jgi:hypothetical protein
MGTMIIVLVLRIGLLRRGKEPVSLILALKPGSDRLNIIAKTTVCHMLSILATIKATPPKATLKFLKDLNCGKRKSDMD